MEIREVLFKFVESFLLALIPVLVPMAIAWFVPKIRSAWNDLKRENAQLSWMLEGLASMAVKAAEQSNLAGLVIDKKQYALDIVQQWLKKNKINIDPYLIDAAIEAAVLEEFNKHKLEGPITG